MNISIVEMKATVKKLGKSPTWPDKVDRMSDAQVTALYLRMKSEKKL